MSEPLMVVTMASFGLVGLSIATFAGLRGWQGWLEVRRLELAGSGCNSWLAALLSRRSAARAGGVGRNACERAAAGLGRTYEATAAVRMRKCGRMFWPWHSWRC